MYFGAQYFQAKYFLARYLNGLIQRIEQGTAGFIRKRKRFKFDDRPTDEQIRAERIRLGIIEARKERTRIIKKAQKAKKGSEQRKELDTYIALLRVEITRLQGEYDALKADLDARGDLIRSAVITREAMLMIEEEIRLAQQEEEDISFVLAMLLEL